MKWYCSCAFAIMNIYSNEYNVDVDNYTTACPTVIMSAFKAVNMNSDQIFISY